MTLNDLCACNADTLDDLKKQGKLDEYLAPYFKVTRPELGTYKDGPVKAVKVLSPEEEEKARKVKKAKDLMSLLLNNPHMLPKPKQ